MIGDAIAAVLPLMRAHAESLMADTCTIHRESTSWDEVEQKSVTTWTVVAAGVPCSFEQPTESARALLTDETVTPESPLLALPVAVDSVEPDDRVTITAVGPLSEPTLVGATLWVTHAVVDTHPVERLVQCRWSR